MEYTFQEMPDIHKKGERKVYPKATHCSQIDNDFFMKNLAARTSYGVGTLEGVVAEVVAEMDHYLMHGHSVKVDGLGTFNIALGMKTGHATEEVREDGGRYDTNGVYIKGVNFIPDAGWMARLRRQIELHKVGNVKRIVEARTTLRDRYRIALDYLSEHPFMKVSDYARMNGMSHSAACKELRALALDPTIDISTVGNGSHKVYVKKALRG